MPVTRRTVWIRSASRSGDSAADPCRILADRPRRPLPEAVAVEDRDRVAGPGESGTVGIGDRVDVVAGDVGDGQVDEGRRQRRRRASRPPLNAETCLRTVLTSTIPMPEESSSSCRARFSAGDDARPVAGSRAPSCRR